MRGFHNYTGNVFFLLAVLATTGCLPGGNKNGGNTIDPSRACEIERSRGPMISSRVSANPENDGKAPQDPNGQPAGGAPSARVALRPGQGENRYIPFQGPNGIFASNRGGDNPRTIAKHQLNQPRNIRLESPPPAPFRVVAGSDGMTLELDENATPENTPGSVQIRVRAEDGCGQPAFAELTLFPDFSPKPIGQLGNQPRADGTQVVDGNGFGNSGSTGTRQVFVQDGVSTSGESQAGLAQTAHVAAPGQTN